MHLANLRLRDFRNYARLDVAFGPGFHLLLGNNAQGKTNILEAIYLLATLRSFRGVGGAQMIRHGQKGYFVGGTIISNEEHVVKLYWSQTERKITLDNNPVKRLIDYWGTLRAVVFCTEDLQLVKGTGRMRRRFLDLLLAQTEPSFLPLLQRYMASLRSRNAILKQRTLDQAALESFTHQLITLGRSIIDYRQRLVPLLSNLTADAYKRISGGAETFRAKYAPSVSSDFAVELANSRDRERTYRSTLVGPHRDELQLLLDDKPAGKFGSEGQKRSIAIALKIAQAEYLSDAKGVPPVLLIDDVMGELDLKRRAGLMPLLERADRGRGQVFMTCTEENWPEELGRTLNRWNVDSGTLTQK